MKYAVYVVVVEDTGDQDMRVMSDVVEGERLAGDLTSDEASALLWDAGDLPGTNFRYAKDNRE